MRCLGLFTDLPLNHDGKKLDATSAAPDNTTEPSSNAAERIVICSPFPVSPSARKTEQKGSCPTTKTLAPEGRRFVSNRSERDGVVATKSAHA